jgi:nondiscriminating aspartyl-tRNA synthetase
MRAEGFTEINTSKLIGTGTEGGTGLFSVEYFDTKVFLAQSPQFYKQAMVASGLERAFEIGCAYRAEKHETPRGTSTSTSPWTWRLPGSTASRT